MTTKTTTIPTVDVVLQLTKVDPRSLQTADQIRDDATPDDQLVESVRRSGILQPPTVVQDTDGGYTIVFGHRRVGAAILAGLTEIDVIVRDRENLPAVVALGDQIVENERRKGLSPAEVARGWADLEQLFGLTPEQIAESLAEQPERVRAGIRTARSQSTVKLLEERPTIDLEKAAILTDFDAHPDVQTKLARTAADSPHNFEYELRAARATVERQARRAELEAEITAAGMQIAATDQWGALEKPAARLSRLQGRDGDEMTVDEHEACAGRSAFVEGYSAENLTIVHTCLDPTTHGHEARVGTRHVPTDEEARIEREREEAKAQKLANRAARRQWIQDLLPGKINQLSGVYDYMAGALLDNSTYYYDDPREPQVTLSLLNVDAGENASKTLDDVIDGKSVAPFRLMLAVAFAVYEEKCNNASNFAMQIKHFEQLQKWGYALSDFDKAALENWQANLAAEDPDSDEAGDIDLEAEDA